MLRLLDNPVELFRAIAGSTLIVWDNYDKLEDYYAKEPWSLARNLAFHCRRDFSFMRDITTHGMAMLDYGAGVGYFTSASRAYSKLAVDVPGIPTDWLSFAFPDIEVAGAPYVPRAEAWDMIVCVDVLEHILEPMEILKVLINGLRIGGKFLYFFADTVHDSGHVSTECKDKCETLMLDACVLKKKVGEGRYYLYERRR